MDEQECWARVGASRRAVLGTLHPRRGIDSVPVVFALDGGRIVIPIDSVKPKGSHRLQRLVNIEHDPRCVLLIDHYDEDWSRLWWVRIHAQAIESAPSERHLAALADRYPQYRVPGSVVGTVVLEPAEIRGWTAV